MNLREGEGAVQSHDSSSSLNLGDRSGMVRLTWFGTASWGGFNVHCGNASVFRTLSYKMRHDTTRASARVVSDAFFKTKSERPKH